jgi:uncharacterized membrane-anchored protein
LTILFTFALGTSAGDLVAEQAQLVYLPSALLFGGAIALIGLVHVRLKLNAVLSFWMAYVLTRLLGASMATGCPSPSTREGLDWGP